ncbi:MAG TPA: DUF58 domain-containing protein [Rhodocyclaceae bacterium]|nr:DUF58 domain-containing protein [Rhodocyclaceae bacterium]
MPSRTLLAALGVWLLCAFVAAWSPDFVLPWTVFGIVMGLWAFSDFWLARWQAPPAMQRVVNSSLPLGEWSHAELRLHWSGSVPHHVEMFDHVPAQFEQQGLPAHIDTRRGNSFAVRYRIRPLARGDHLFDGVALRVCSPWRAWQRQLRLGEAHPVKVYPNFAPLARDALRAIDHRQSQTGLLRRRRRGQGMDFAQLREYREGDSLRQIDWKATSRIGKIISREYQEYRDQRIFLLIDCGRRMGARDGALSHFDHSLDAALMLAYVGLRHGDNVGLMTLGGPERLVPPQRSAGMVSRLLHATYDLQPTLHASDFERAAQRLMEHERKRALVVILTNLRDEDDQSLRAATHLLQQRHLVLVASLREPALDRMPSQAIDSLHDAASAAAAVGYRHLREAALQRLRASGVLCLDVVPEMLAVETVNRYLAIKAANML